MLLTFSHSFWEKLKKIVKGKKCEKCLVEKGKISFLNILTSSTITDKYIKRMNKKTCVLERKKKNENKM